MKGQTLKFNIQIQKGKTWHAFIQGEYSELGL